MFLRINFFRFLLPVLAVACLCFLSAALAHPADEFCTPDSGLDPELCRALSEMDKAEPVPTGPEVIDYGGTEVEISLERPILETVSLYLRMGYVHILPRGYDHILFVLALFLAATNFRQLIWQISAFTLAHTITLGLATIGAISASPAFVEPLIALSIAFVAIENLLMATMARWRPLVVFGFGLFHGLGFATVLKDLGLVQSQLVQSLISFNVGVELGQISVIGLAALAVFIVTKLKPEMRQQANHRRYIIIPGSLTIALFGLFWFVNRLIGLIT